MGRIDLLQAPRRHGGPRVAGQSASGPREPRAARVFVWGLGEEARRFVDELKEQTGITGWCVEETAPPPSSAPFGPVLIQLARRSDGLVLTLHPSSLAMIWEAYPDARPSATNTLVDTQTWNDFLKKQETLSDLLKEILPFLTGLDFIDSRSSIGCSGGRDFQAFCGPLRVGRSPR